MIRTIGHSTHEPEEFVARCKHGGVRTVVDVRSHPTSRWEWFRRENMDPELNPNSWLAKAGLQYAWMPELGGWTARHLDEPLLVQPATGMPLPADARDGAHTLQQVKLAEWATGHGVDISAYARGFFPKNRIAASTAVPGTAWTNQGLYDYAWYTALPEFRKAAEQLADQAHEGGELERPAIMCAEFLWWKCHRSMVADYLYWRGKTVWHLQPRMTDHAAAIGNRIERYPEQVRAVWGAQVPHKRPGGQQMTIDG